MLFVEFFNQGDHEKEKGLNVSMFMDRKTTNIASSQMGFIDFIIKPSFEVTSMLFPSLYRLNEGVENNKKQWETRISAYVPEINNNIKRPSNKSEPKGAKSQFAQGSRQVTDSQGKAKSFGSSSMSSLTSNQSDNQEAPKTKTIELQDLDQNGEEPDKPKMKLL